MINVVMLRGVAGTIFSTGLDMLSFKIAKMQNVDYVVVSPYTDWKGWLQHFERWEDPTVFIGHSFGANAITRIANETKKKIPLLVTLDTSSWFSFQLMQAGPMNIPNNVDKVINYRQPYGFLMKGRDLKRTDGTTKGITNIEVNTIHGNVDDLPEVQERIIKELDKLG